MSRVVSDCEDCGELECCNGETCGYDCCNADECGCVRTIESTQIAKAKEYATSLRDKPCPRCGIKDIQAISIEHDGKDIWVFHQKELPKRKPNKYGSRYVCEFPMPKTKPTRKTALLEGRA